MPTECSHCGRSFADSSQPHYCALVASINEQRQELQLNQTVGVPKKRNTPQQSQPKMLNNMPEGTRNLALVGDPGDPDNEFELDDEVDIGKQENIKVVVRVRPLMEHEVLRTAGSDGNPDNGHQVLSLDPPDGKSLTVNGAEARHQLRVRFDACFGAESTQEQVYSQIKECASAVVQGVNATVFAYGQTGTGKTHTMFGPPGHVQELAAAGGQGAHAFGAMSGVIPRALVDVFEQLHALATPTQQQQQQQHGGQGDEGEASPTATIASYAVYVSFVQIYNEQVFDMLRDPSRGKPLEIHEEDMGGGVYVQGLSEYGVGSFADCLELLRLGEENRAIRETHMNQASSRSHSIFTVLVEQTRRPQRPSSAEGGGGGGVSEEGAGRQLRSKFNLVDLAGSEKWDLNQDMVSERVAEMTNINLSLYTLGRCIAALATQSKKQNRADKAAALGGDGGDFDDGGGGGGLSSMTQQHVPFRDSKLTRLLQDSLGGNAKTRVIATLSPSRDCVDESVSTLRFADRAKQVMVLLRVNDTRGGAADPKLVARLQREVAHLRQLVKQLSSSSGEQQPTLEQEQRQQLRRDDGEESVEEVGKGCGGSGVRVSPLSSPGRRHKGGSHPSPLVASDLLERQLREASKENESLRAEVFALRSGQPYQQHAGGGRGSGGDGLKLPTLPGASPSKDREYGNGGSGGGAGARAVAEMEGRVEALRGTNTVLSEAMEGVAAAATQFFAFEIEEDALKAALEKWTKKGAEAMEQQRERYEKLGGTERERGAGKRDKAAAAAASRGAKTHQSPPRPAPAARIVDGKGKSKHKTSATTTATAEKGLAMPSVVQKKKTQQQPQQTAASGNNAASTDEGASASSPLFRQSARSLQQYPHHRLPSHDAGEAGRESVVGKSASAPNTNRSPLSQHGGGESSSPGQARRSGRSDGGGGLLRRSSDRTGRTSSSSPGGGGGGGGSCRRGGGEAVGAVTSHHPRPEPLSHPSAFNNGSNGGGAGLLSGAPLSSGLGRAALHGAPTSTTNAGSGKLSFRVRGRQGGASGGGGIGVGVGGRPKIVGDGAESERRRRDRNGGGSSSGAAVAEEGFEEDDDDDDEAKLAKELGKAKARMKKHKQLQEWLRRKEEREMALLDEEEALVAEQDQAAAKKERQRQQRARKEKQRLEDFYAKLHAEADQKEAGEAAGGGDEDGSDIGSDDGSGNGGIVRDDESAAALTRTQAASATLRRSAAPSEGGIEYSEEEEEEEENEAGDYNGAPSSVGSHKNNFTAAEKLKERREEILHTSLQSQKSRHAAPSQEEMFGDDGLAPYGEDNGASGGERGGEYDDFIGDGSLMSGEGDVGFDDNDE